MYVIAKNLISQIETKFYKSGLPSCEFNFYKTHSSNQKNTHNSAFTNLLSKLRLVFIHGRTVLWV